MFDQDPSTEMFEEVPNGGLLVYYENRGNADPSNGGPGLKVSFILYIILILTSLSDVPCWV